MPRFIVLLSFICCLSACVSSQPISPDQGLQAQYEKVFYAITSDGDEGFQGTPTAAMLEDAIVQLTPLAEAGHASSAALLGSIYTGFFGDQIELDYSKARSNYRIAMEADDPFQRPIACINLAFLAMDADPDGDDWFEVRKLAECAREQDELRVHAAKPLAFSYLFGPDQETQTPKAEPLLREWLVENNDDAHSAYLFAKGLRNGWFETEDDEEACKNFLVASELEDHRAHWYTGMCYLQGIHVEKNEETAFKWVNLAAENDEIDGLISLAVMYALGQGTDVSPVKAAAAYEAAITAAPPGSVKQGHALRGLGSMHAFEELEDPNHLFGYTLLVLANEYGDDQAPLLLQRFDELEPESLKQVEVEKKRVQEKYDLPIGE